MSSSSSSSLHHPVRPCLAVEHELGDELYTAFFSAAAGGSANKPIIDEALLDLLNCEEIFCPTPLGWILARDDESGSTYLLDPHARPERKRIQLPPLRGIADDLLVYCNCLLSDQPTAPAGCVVLLVQPDDTVIWYHHIGRPGSHGGSGDWIRHEYDIGTQGDQYFREKIPIVSIAAYQGKFYFNARFFDEMGVLEFCPEPVFSSITTTTTTTMSDAMVRTKELGVAAVFMVESDGELFMVMLPRSQPVQVYKMDFSDRRWSPVDDLGGRAFFLAPFNFGASCLAAAGGNHAGVEQNCVYSVRYLSDKFFTVYNVKDGTERVHSLQDPDQGGALSGIIDRTLWMLPTHQN